MARRGGAAAGSLIVQLIGLSSLAAVARSRSAVFAGGYFTSAPPSASALSYVGEWDVDAAAWTALGPGADAYINAFAVHAGTLYAGGWQYHAGATLVNHIGAWQDGAWAALGSGTDNVVYALASFDGALVAGGTFGTAGGLPAAHVASWNGTAWAALGAGTSSKVAALAVYENVLHVGGDFANAGDVVGVDFLACWNGTAWSALGGGGAGLNGFVMALVVYNGALLAGGSFSASGAVSLSGIGQWNGTAWAPLGAGMGGTVLALALFQGGVVAGGTFATAGAVNASNVAAWDGAAWSALGAGTNGTVSALVAYNNNGTVLIAGGQFSAAGTAYTGHMAVWNGTDWSAPAGGSPSDAVNALAVYCAHGWTGALCDSCLPGVYGPACAASCPSCGAYGQCLDGPTGNGTCACSPGWAGPQCTVCAAGYYGATCIPCPSSCGAHAACSDGLSGNGLCVCALGWTGSACDTCAPGWTGPLCDACASNYYGANCTACPGVCQNGGACSDGLSGNGTCLCPPHVVGSLCTACAAGYYGPTCAPCPACNHGACRDGLTNNGTCECTAGWSEPTCTACAPGYVGAACLACPDCIMGVCTEAAVCSCDPGWNGTLCDVCQTDFFGLSCSACTVTCAHGQCSDGLSGTGSCVCDAAWSGPQCDTCAPAHFGPSCQACPQCVQGACNSTLDGNGVCVCAFPWSGPLCDDCVSGFYGPQCVQCFCAHGQCSDGISGSGTCNCSVGWTGPYCETCAPGYGGSSCALITADAASTGLSVEVIIGIAVAGVVLIALVILAILLARRKTSAAEQMLLDYSSQIQLLALEKAREKSAPAATVDDSFKYCLAVPVGKGGDKTPVADIAFISDNLPAFLQLDYITDLSHNEAASTTNGGVGRAVLVNKETLERVGGGDLCATKEFVGQPGNSEDDDTKRFLREVAIIWELSFHPNVVQLIGYCKQPRVIVTRLYPTDLFRYLHGNTATHAPLPSDVVLYLCTSMAAAVAAVHSLGIAHRNIKTSNFCLREPGPRSCIPDPVLCGFGMTRGSDEGASKLKRISPRYVAPEVFVRSNLPPRYWTNTLADDMASDVYSLGVVFWETARRQIPWDRYKNEDIEQRIQSGARLAALDVVPDNPVAVALADVVGKALQMVPADRPPVLTIHHTLAECMRGLISKEPPAAV